MSIAQAPVAALLILAVATALVWVLAAIWEDKMLPVTPRFARAQPPFSTRQLREDHNARVFADHSGFLVGRGPYFVGE